MDIWEETISSEKCAEEKIYAHLDRRDFDLKDATDCCSEAAQRGSDYFSGDAHSCNELVTLDDSILINWHQNTYFQICIYLRGRICIQPW